MSTESQVRIRFFLIIINYISVVTINCRYLMCKYLKIRSSNCSYHCLQILSARTLLFMSLNEEVKSELVKEPQLKILAASLESTNDPVSTIPIMLLDFDLFPKNLLTIKFGVSKQIGFTSLLSLLF